MSSSDDHDRLTDARQVLLDLLVQQDEAGNHKEWQRVAALETQIEAARASRDKLKRPG